MRRVFLAAILAFGSGAVAAADVAISVGVSQPGLYGRVDIGAMPQPPVIYQQPVLIQQAPMVVTRQPIYLHVPPGHARDWRKHCNRYGACGQPVYFVQEDWYQNVYVRERGDRHHEHGDGHRHGRGHRDH